MTSSEQIQNVNSNCLVSNCFSIILNRGVNVTLLRNHYTARGAFCLSVKEEHLSQIDGAAAWMSAGNTALIKRCHIKQKAMKQQAAERRVEINDIQDFAATCWFLKLYRHLPTKVEVKVKKVEPERRKKGKMKD